MNQKSIELLSSEELEIVTGGDGVKDFFLGLVDPIRSCVPKGASGDSFGTFNKEALAASAGKATSSAILTASLVATAIYGTYKLTGVLSSKFGKKAEDAEKQQPSESF